MPIVPDIAFSRAKVHVLTILVRKEVMSGGCELLACIPRGKITIVFRTLTAPRRTNLSISDRPALGVGVEIFPPTPYIPNGKADT